MIKVMGEIGEYPVSVVGGWRHDKPDSPPAREVAERPDFWPGELSREELVRRIRLAGGIKPEYALEARQLISGEVLLVHGCHRWAAAAELGVSSVPVQMDLEVEPGDEVWSTW
jgi:hypothetical protein